MKIMLHALGEFRLVSIFIACVDWVGVPSWESTLTNSTPNKWVFYCVFYVQPSDFCSLFKVKHVTGTLIMTYYRPLLHASYEVILLPSSIWLQQKCFPCGGSISGHLNHLYKIWIKYYMNITKVRFWLSWMYIKSV